MDSYCAGNNSGCVNHGIVWMEEEIMKLDDVMGLGEAAERWNMARITLKKACAGQNGSAPRFIVGEECKKSGGIWLVTRAGMERLYGEEENSL